MFRFAYRAMALVMFCSATAMAAEPAFRDDGRMYGPWHSARIGGGGWAQQVVSCPSDPNRLYVYVDMAGVYRSDDAGQHWRMMHAGLPGRDGGYEIRGLDVDPRDADRILIAVGNRWSFRCGLMLSRDGGHTYTRVLEAQFAGNGVPHRDAGYILARHPKQPDVIVAGSYGDGVYRSTDNGQTWQDCGIKDYMVTDIRFDASTGNRVWLSAQPWSGKVIRTERKLLGGFFESSDAGATWKKLSDESPTEVVQDSSDPNHLLGIFGNTEVRHSKDGGQTWSSYSDGLPVNQAQSNATLSPSRFTVLAAGPGFFLTGNRPGEIFRLNHGQTTWQIIKPEKVNGGDWWANDGNRPGWVHFGKAFGSIWIDPRNANHWMRTDWFAIWETLDAGAHWQLRIDGYEPDVVFQIAPQPGNNQIVHLVMSDNGYFRSADGGRRFTKVDQGGIPSQTRDLVVSEATPNQVYVIGTMPHVAGEWLCNQLYVSVDAGIHWRATAMKGIPDRKQHDTTSVALDPADASHVYLTVSGEIGPNRGGVYYSADNGENFSWIGEGLPAAKTFFRSGFWSSGGRELIFTSDGRLLAMSKSANALYAWDSAAQKWNAMSMPDSGRILGLAVDPTTPGRMIASLEGKGLYLSEKGGEAGSWVRTSSEKPGIHVAFDPQHSGVVAAVTTEHNTGVLLSRDGGRTWRLLDQQLPLRMDDLNPAFVDGRLFVATHGAGAFEYMGE